MEDKNHFLYFVSTSVLLSILTISAFMLTDSNKNQQAKRPLNTKASEITPTPFLMGELITNIQKELTLASHSDQQSSPDNAIDGNEGSSWEAGLAATPENPQWLEINLSNSTLNQANKITTLQLYSNQNSAEQAVHKIYAGNTPTTLRLVHTFTQTVQPQEILTVTFNPPLENDSYLRIETEQSTFPVSWKEIKIYQSPSTLEQ